MVTRSIEINAVIVRGHNNQVTTDTGIPMDTGWIHHNRRKIHWRIVVRIVVFSTIIFIPRIQMIVLSFDIRWTMGEWNIVWCFGAFIITTNFGQAFDRTPISSTGTFNEDSSDSEEAPCEIMRDTK